MDASHLHLLLAHVPVIAAVFAAATLIAGVRRDDRGLQGTALAMVVVAAVFAVGAYYSGPPAREVLRPVLADATQPLIDQHATIARLALVLGILAAVLAVQGFLQLSSGERASVWLRWSLVVVLLALVYVGAWTAHLGGRIQHPELRETDGLLFPALGLEDRDDRPGPQSSLDSPARRGAR